MELLSFLDTVNVGYIDSGLEGQDSLIPITYERLSSKDNFPMDEMLDRVVVVVQNQNTGSALRLPICLDLVIPLCYTRFLKDYQNEPCPRPLCILFVHSHQQGLQSLFRRQGSHHQINC